MYSILFKRGGNVTHHSGDEKLTPEGLWLQRVDQRLTRLDFLVEEAKHVLNGYEQNGNPYDPSKNLPWQMKRIDIMQKGVD